MGAVTESLTDDVASDTPMIDDGHAKEYSRNYQNEEITTCHQERGVKMTTMITSENIEDTKDNRNLLWQIAKQACAVDGSFDDLDAYPMDELDEALYGLSPSDIVNKVHYGDFNPADDYFTFDGYGNLESVDSLTLQDDAWEQRNAIIEWANDNRPEVSGLLDSLTVNDDDAEQ